MGTETEYKKQLRTVFGGWSEAYEPGFGSGTGYPDLQFRIDRYGLIPIEIKKGSIHTKKDVIKSNSIRPSQMSWHDEFLKSDGISFIFVCFGDRDEFCVWSIPLPFREQTKRWKVGWRLKECKQIISRGKIVKDLSSLVAEAREELSLIKSEKNLVRLRS
jgi:hypothetical protein